MRGTSAVFLAAALAAAAALSPAPRALAGSGHEYAPIEEQEVEIRDWTLPALDEKAPAVNLRAAAKGKKLLLVVYYAPWCGNWHYEAPVLARLYEKYKDKGLAVVAVNNYGPRAEARAFFERAGAPGYAVAVESEAREAREKTAHYALRQACGDDRAWGSPFNVFVDAAAIPPEGDLLAARAWVAGGELVEEEADEFIRKRLGLE